MERPEVPGILREGENAPTCAHRDRNREREREREGREREPHVPVTGLPAPG